MLDIKNENNVISIIISEPTPEETEIIERAKAVQAGIPYQHRKQSKEEIKSMFAKFRCNQNRGEQTEKETEKATRTAAPISQTPNIPDKYFAPADEIPDDDYPF